jgi:ABC-type protease/lipase transport system fused ATPase/permease subunit
LERIYGYLQIEQEPKATRSGIPPAYWPASGELRVENLSAKYSQDGPKVLHDISFHIKSGERIGVGMSGLAMEEAIFKPFVSGQDWLWKGNVLDIHSYSASDSKKHS